MRTVSTAEYVAYIKAGRVKSVLPMIADKARTTWSKLPDSEKMVRSLADLIQEGINFTVIHVAEKFNVRCGVKFTTFLFTALDNFYTDIIRKIYSEKRLIPHGMLSLDSSNAEVKGKQISLIDKIRLTHRYDIENKLISRIDAERSFLKAYAKASPKLRHYLIRWLLQPKPGRSKPGADFNNARLEFRKSTNKILTYNICKFIQDDYICQTTIAESVAKMFHTDRKANKKAFCFTEEFQLMPMLSGKCIEQLIPVIA